MVSSNSPAARIGLYGATGYTGQELLRLLLDHPAAQLHAVASQRRAGQPVAEALPQCRGRLDMDFCAPAALADCDLVLLALPNGLAMEQVPALLDAGARVIDLSADFRLPEDLWLEVYSRPVAHDPPHLCPALLPEAVYGLPELHRSRIAGARLVANPGCYPTATLLALAPLLKAGIITPEVIVDAKSGVTGAGRRVTEALLYGEVAGSLRPYGLPEHRHGPEITAALEQELSLLFVPHLVPMKRGLLATLYAHRKPGVTTNVQALLEQHYAEEPCVTVLPLGSFPDTGTILGSNQCLLAVHEQDSRLVLFSAIDNLTKGAAGQAVQNMNIMLGLPETTGLDNMPWRP